LTGGANFPKQQKLSSRVGRVSGQCLRPTCSSAWSCRAKTCGYWDNRRSV
jgi:hypothetical protein